GGGGFTEQDEEFVVALAAAAGIAVENAWLYETSRRRQRVQEVTASVATELLAGTSWEAALRAVAENAQDLAEADLACIIVPDAVRGDLYVAVAAGAAGTKV